MGLKPITVTRDELEKNPKLQKEIAHRTVSSSTSTDPETGQKIERLTFTGYTESVIRKAKLLKKKPTELTRDEISKPYKVLRKELASRRKKS